MPFVPVGCVDTGNGYYDPTDQCLYDYKGRFVRVPSKDEAEWAMRKGRIGVDDSLSRAKDAKANAQQCALEEAEAKAMGRVKEIEGTVVKELRKLGLGDVRVRDEEERQAYGMNRDNNDDDERVDEDGGVTGEGGYSYHQGVEIVGVDESDEGRRGSDQSTYPASTHTHPESAFLHSSSLSSSSATSSSIPSSTIPNSIYDQVLFADDPARDVQGLPMSSSILPSSTTSSSLVDQLYESLGGALTGPLSHEDSNDNPSQVNSRTPIAHSSNNANEVVSAPTSPRSARQVAENLSLTSSPALERFAEDYTTNVIKDAINSFRSTGSGASRNDDDYDDRDQEYRGVGRSIGDEIESDRQLSTGRSGGYSHGENASRYGVEDDAGEEVTESARRREGEETGIDESYRSGQDEHGYHETGRYGGYRDQEGMERGLGDVTSDMEPTSSRLNDSMLNESARQGAWTGEEGLEEGLEEGEGEDVTDSRYGGAGYAEGYEGEGEMEMMNSGEEVYGTVSEGDGQGEDAHEVGIMDGEGYPGQNVQGHDDVHTGYGGNATVDDDDDDDQED